MLSLMIECPDCGKKWVKHCVLGLMSEEKQNCQFCSLYMCFVDKYAKQINKICDKIDKNYEQSL